MAPEAICPQPGIALAAAVNPSYTVSATYVTVPYFPPYSLEGPVAAPNAVPATVAANP